MEEENIHTPCFFLVGCMKYYKDDEWMGYANFQVKMVWVKIQGKHFFTNSKTNNFDIYGKLIVWLDKVLRALYAISLFSS